MQKTILLLLFTFFFSSAQAQLNMSLLSQLDYDVSLNDIWGWAAPDGTEYALVGARNGVSIVSLADPNNAIEVAFIPGQNSAWRDLKTQGNWAYVVTDQGGTTEGVTVIDLSDLPNSAPFYHWTPDLTGLGVLESCHNIYIDEFGYAYLSGCNLNGGGMLMLDVFSDPGNPIFVGPAPPNYAHDVYVRDNKMYAAEIYNGELAIYDVSDKDNVSFLGSHLTPSEFTHNVWLSEDGTVAFTTDERANAPVTAYDVTDPEEIMELDQFRPLQSLGTGVIPHNVHTWGEDWLVISYYTDGGIIADASRPDNIIEVGNFDSFLGANGGYNGAWGLYPFLPSGIVLVTDIGNGLYVLDANYVRACWLEGNITDAATGDPIFDAGVEILSGQLNAGNSDLFGNYKTGQANSGTFDVVFSKPGYQSKTVEAVLDNGLLTILDVELTPLASYSISGLVLNDSDGSPISGANVFMTNGISTFETISDGNGQFTITVFESTFNIFVGAWGYQLEAIEDLFVDGDNSISINLVAGYQDDFAVDLGWHATNDGSASTGFWEIGIPNGTESAPGIFSNPGADIDGDFGNQCYVTGNAGGGLGEDDVDGAFVYLTSPPMDLTAYENPLLSYQLWWVNIGGNGSPNDDFKVYVSNGTSEILLETLLTDDSTPEWRPASEFYLKDYIELTDNMTIQFVTGDQPSGHIVEAAVDGFSVIEDIVEGTNTFAAPIHDLSFAPNPFSEYLSVNYEIKVSFQNANFRIYNSIGQLIQTQRLDANKGNLKLGSTLQAGLYFTQLNVDGQNVETFTVVKE